MSEGKCPLCPHCTEPATADNPRDLAMEMLGEQFAGLFDGDAGEQRARDWLASETLFVVGPLGTEIRRRTDA